MGMTYEEIVATKCRLEGVLRRGVELYLEGKPTSPADILECMVNEEALYMPDFVLDDNGELIQIRYDRINEY